MSADASPLDGPPQDNLERAFRLPEQIRDDAELVELHSEIVTRLRREAVGLPMNTVQQLLLERIATSYVMTKMREENGQLSLRDTKEQNAHWLAMTQEFNKLLTASEDKLREALFNEVTSIVMKSIDTIQDPELRRTLKRNLAGEFAALDI